MNSPSEVKARASKLRDALTAIGHQLKHTESLEVISKIEGYTDWNTCTAVLTKKRKIAERYPLFITEAAALKVKVLIEEEGNPDLMLRVFVTGGGGSEFQYGFTFDELINGGDTEIKKEGVKFLIDPVSFQYLNGAEVDYTEGYEGSQFVIRNPNAMNSPSEVEARASRLRDILADMGHQLKHTESLEVISKVEGYADWSTYTAALTMKQQSAVQKLESEILYCSFCGKSQHEVLKLIAGPAVQICDECTDLCVDIVNEERNEQDKENKNTDADKLK